MTAETLATEMQTKLQFAPPLGHKIKFDLGDDGALLLDGTAQPPTVTTDADGDAETTLRMSADSLQGMINGTLNPTMAFMTGKLKVDGNMGVAMKLSSLLDD
ncbi:MAG: SCP2 sterol-binding domain-containing protein [Alphaproteobacteria bacterium]